MAQGQKSWMSWINSKFLPNCQQISAEVHIQYRRLKNQQSTHDYSEKSQRSGLKLLQPLKNNGDLAKNTAHDRKNSQRLTMNKLKQQMQRNDLKQVQIQKQFTPTLIYSQQLDILKSNKLSSMPFRKVQPPKNIHIFQQEAQMKEIKINRISIPQKNSLNQTKFSTTGRLSSTLSKTPQNQQVQAPQNVLFPSLQLPKIRSQSSMAYSSQTSFHQRLEYQSQCRMSQKEIQQIQSLEQSRVSQCISHASSHKIRLDESIVQWTYQTGFKNESNKFSQQKN